MADNKGSSSNPAKGLVSHLDRNRSLQQDRVVASPSSSSSGTSFRSRPQHHSTASAEAGFTNFTTATQLGALPLRPANQQPPAFRPELGRTWLHEFNRSSASQVQDPRTMSSFVRTGAQAAAVQRAANQGAATQGTVDQSPADQNGISSSDASGAFQGPASAFYHPMAINQPAPHLNPGLYQGVNPTFYHTGPGGQFDADPQIMAGFERVRGAFQQHMGNLAGATPDTDQYNVYPEQVLADNPGLAMEAAFAAYDQDFEKEMDDWMGAHGPENRVDHAQNMELRDELHQPVAGQTEFGTSINPAVPGSSMETHQQEADYPLGKHSEESRNMTWKERALKQDLPEDAEMREHAVQILGTLASEGSAETKKKLQSSSFHGLMEAIASGKAVVHGESFVDSTTGVMIEDWEALGDRSIQNGKNNAEGEADGKGKGKMKSLEEQAKEKQGADGGSTASA